MRIPKTIKAIGHTEMSAGIIGGLVDCNIVISPQRTIMVPMAIPTMAPPRGKPKHSLSMRLYVAFSPTAYNEAPHCTQTFASSAFFVPHLVQYTISIHHGIIHR
jgi:hypothetical protein